MIYENTKRVDFADSDQTGFMSAKALMRAMVETSIRHSNEVGGVEDDKEAWVLLKWEVEFLAFPRPGDRLTVRTYTTGFNKFYAYREFLVTGTNEVARAKTTWLLLGANGRPRRISDALAARFEAEPSAFDFPRLDGDENAKADREIEFPVRTFHIDGNGHVNNLVYVDWLLEPVPDEMRAKRLRYLTLTYRKQVVHPEIVLSGIRMDGMRISHTITEKTSGEKRAWAVTVWE